MACLALIPRVICSVRIKTTDSLFRTRELYMHILSFADALRTSQMYICFLREVNIFLFSHERSKKDLKVHFYFFSA